MTGLTQREVADAFDVPPWLLGPDIPRTRREVLSWRLRWFRRLPRRIGRRCNKILRRFDR